MPNRYANYITNDAESVQWKVLARGNDKIQAIKSFRTRTNSGLKEAKDVVEDYLNRLKAGERFNGTHTQTRIINLPTGVLTITEMASGRITITHTETLADSVTVENLPETIARISFDLARRVL